MNTNINPCINHHINVDVLGDIISFLDIAEDKSILNIHKQLFNLTDNESNKILRTWKNNSKYEYTEDKDGLKEWYVNGKLHREADKPAVEHADGSKEWWVNGKKHRDNDLPAVEWVSGYKAWYIKGKRHRGADLPAIEYSDGSKEWYVNGKIHRDADRPASEWANGSKQWYVNGIKIR